jgi:cupin fold WbuC family metalloprotein
MLTERIEHNGILFALIIRHGQKEEGIKFYTPDENALQVGHHNYKKGKVIKPHRHCVIKTERNETMQEVLFVTKGTVKILFYTDEGAKLTEKLLGAGDTVVVIAGGHGYEMMDDTEFLEVKQGPYNPESKKSLEVKG